MAPPKTSTEQTTIRLTASDKTNIDRIIKTGIATNTSEAIRVALAAVAYQLVHPTLTQKRAVNIVEEEVRRQTRR